MTAMAAKVLSTNKTPTNNHCEVQKLFKPDNPCVDESSYMDISRNAVQDKQRALWTISEFAKAVYSH